MSSWELIGPIPPRDADMTHRRHGGPGPGRSFASPRAFEGTGYPAASEEMPSRNWQGSARRCDVYDARDVGAPLPGCRAAVYRSRDGHAGDRTHFDPEVVSDFVRRCSYPLE